MEFHYKNVTVDVPESRLEVCRLRANFEIYAEGLREEIMRSFRATFQDMRTFLEKGDAWAHGFIDRGADVVIRELAALDCFDIDRETWVEKYIDYSFWENYTKMYRDQVAALDAEEAAREKKRVERTEEMGATFSEHKIVMASDGEGGGEMRDSLDGGNIIANLGLSAASGIFNMIGRGLSKGAINRQLQETFDSEDFRLSVELGITSSIANAYMAFVKYCKKNGVKDFDIITEEDEKRSNRLVNNICRGLIPAEKIDAQIANTLVTTPYCERIYQWMLLQGEDTDGKVAKIADFFSFHKLDMLRKVTVLDELGAPDYATEEGLHATKDKLTKLARSVQLPEGELQQMLMQQDKAYAEYQETQRIIAEEEAKKEKIKEGLSYIPLFGVIFAIFGKKKAKKAKSTTATLRGAMNAETVAALRHQLVTAMTDAGYSVQDGKDGVHVTGKSWDLQSDYTIAVKAGPNGNECEVNLEGEYKARFMYRVVCLLCIILLFPTSGITLIILVFLLMRHNKANKKPVKTFQEALKRIQGEHSLTLVDPKLLEKQD